VSTPDLWVACCLWDANEKSENFSRAYDETWVEKLYRGFKRHLTVPFRFAVFTDRERKFAETVFQIPLQAQVPSYGCLIEPFRLNRPTIICGLDMILLGNIDHFAEYCLSDADRFAAPRNPYDEKICINPIVFVPAGMAHIAMGWTGENDMEWLRRFECRFTDDMWPGQILSYKAHALGNTGPQAARVVYFHGEPKPPKLRAVDWVQRQWI
jgi:hypothetical protein